MDDIPACLARSGARSWHVRGRPAEIVQREHDGQYALWALDLCEHRLVQIHVYPDIREAKDAYQRLNSLPERFHQVEAA